MTNPPPSNQPPVPGQNPGPYYQNSGQQPYQQQPHQQQVPYQGHPPAYQAPQPPKKNWFLRHKILTAIGALILLSMIGSALGGNKSSAPATTAATTTAPAAQPTVTTGAASQVAAPATTTQPAATQTTSAPAALPKIGEVAKDGKTEFTVSAFECGIPHVGSSSFGKDAQGQYCVATISMKNSDNKANTFSHSYQKLLDAAGTQFKSSDDTPYLDGAEIYKDINPGNTLTTKVLFDVPKDAKPTVLELHDSMFSKGVKVSVG